MIKNIALLRKRADLTREAFISYYETRHAPLIAGLFPEISEYRRNYLDLDGAFIFPGAAPIDFDVVTEVVLPDQAAYERFLARSAEPDVARAIAEDEENVFDRDATRMFRVDMMASALTSTSNDPRLKNLLDERAIMRGLSRFARLLDDKDWAALGGVFAEDLGFDYGNGEEAGMAALRANMQRYLDRCGPSQHLLGSIMIDVDGDEATSRAYVQARHQRNDDMAGPVFDSNGEYIDRWERRPEGWRIVRRDAIWATQSGDPAIIMPDE